ncbi:MAG: Uma2 family endonuclease [Chloroflexaceae bacterium]|jgi:Uma2 family endonuclease|nr:Uma2 family endonuclease [Chloroflexaceae bacterium]
MATTALLIEPPAATDEYDPPFHFYDQNPTTEDLMGSSPAQGQLVRYLVSLLEWHYRAEGWFIAADLNIYLRKERYDKPLVPDVALFHVVVPDASQRTYVSWRTYEPDRPPPRVAFEICSDTTWKKDLEEKPGRYATFGVQEYYAYDPNEPPYISEDGERLRGWHLVNGVMVPQPTNAYGHIWSHELEAWLVPDGPFLRLHDRKGQRWLTGIEAEQIEREAAQRAARQERSAKEAEARRAREAAQRATREAQRATNEARRAETERAAREAEARRAETEQAAKEAERAAKEAERAAKEAAWAKLRELGIDPTTL